MSLRSARLSSGSSPQRSEFPPSLCLLSKGRRTKLHPSSPIIDVCTTLLKASFPKKLL